VVRVAERVRNSQLVDAAENDNVASRRSLGLLALQAVETKEFQDAGYVS
jgi:hypothetical protein